MIKKISLKKLIIFTLILISFCIIISPVSAITENIHYETGLTTGTIKVDAGTVSFDHYDLPINLRFGAIEKWVDVKSIVYGIDYHGTANGPNWVCRDINIHTSEVPVIYKIGGVTVSTGIIQFVRHLDSNGNINNGILTYVFDTPLDTELSGLQIITCDYTLADLNIKTYFYSKTGSFVTHTDDCPSIYIATWIYPFQIDSGVGYRYGVFDVSFEYDYTDSTETNIDFSFYRDGTNCYVYMIGDNDIIILDDMSPNDINLYYMYDIPYILNITNPVYKGVGPNEYYEYIIPGDVSTLNIATLSWYAYNKEATGTEVIGVNYNLKIRNETDLTWSTQSSGYNPSYSILEIPNNAYYNMSLTAPDYEPLENYTFSVSGDKTISFGLYPEYGANFSVNFQVRGFSGERIESAKIILNDIIKYTPYNGMVGFGDISGYIEYEISKTGYISLSGNKTITQNTELYIIMKTEDQALEEEDDITPTPIPPDITKPTNLLESIQFAFQKMFGLTSSTEDMETANLFMGLGVIFAGAVLIASITKDALGAVVGGLIGFIMSLALGFIPIWVVFVGFSAFAIYIILTKTGGNA